jgi:hypothetical protein
MILTPHKSQVLNDKGTPLRTLLNCCTIITQLCTLPGGLIAYNMKDIGIMSALLHLVSHTESSDSGLIDAARNAAYSISTAASRASVVSNDTASSYIMHHNVATIQKHDDRTDEQETTG